MPDRALVAVEERVPAPPDREAAPDRTAIGWRDTLGLTFQLALVLAAAVVYRLELERGMAALAVLLLGGFVVHTRLPLRLRAPFFVLLTGCAAAWLLGADAVWLGALGLGIVGLCHLPVAWGIRVALVAAAGAGLAAVLAGLVEVPWGAAVVPILGSMFMFRVILYLYDLKAERTPAGPWQRLAYFFLLPNVSFPLFPIVHVKTFFRGYYDAPAAEIYQKGVHWMLRGVVHLVLYRVVYHALPLTDSLPGILGVASWLVLLYGFLLRVSGLFHFIAGTLCLFGWNLPPTNHHYYLASGFNDLWRRANIYWKDFMMTVAFNPVLMAMRRFPMGTRLFVATVVVFVVTWFLHAYQWFWLRGVFPVTATDAVFWAALGVAVLVNTLRESRKGRARRLGRPAWSWRPALGLTFRVLATYTTMALLWSLWNGGSFAEWWYRLLRAGESTVPQWALFGAGLAAVVAAGVAGQWLQSRGRGLEAVEKLAWRHAPLYVTGTSVLLLVLAQPAVQPRLGRLGDAAAKAQSTALNRIDREREERGYYETLSRATTLRAIADRRAGEQPDDWVGFSDSPAVRPTGDIRAWEIVPGAAVDFKGTAFRANRWGMRDHDYALAKPAGTFRIALVGGSVEMGSGVNDHETYENVLERRLNERLAAGDPILASAGVERYEVLNFSVGGYGMLQTLAVVERSVGRFQPDVVIYPVHNGDVTRMLDRLHLSLQRGTVEGQGYGFVEEALARAGAHGGLPAGEFRRRMAPYRGAVEAEGYRRMAEAIRGYGAVPIFLFMSRTDEQFPPRELARLQGYARAAGGEIVEILGVFQGADPAEIRVSEWDNHPNAYGHRLIADALYEAIQRNPEPWTTP